MPRRDQAYRAGRGVIDITHGIPPPPILQGALVLANTSRTCLSAFTWQSSIPASAGAAPARAARRGRAPLRRARQRAPRSRCRARGDRGGARAREPRVRARPVSRTFHGRDLFSPAAAHLALGVALDELGPPLDPDALVRLDLPEPEIGADADRGDRSLRRQLREHRAQPHSRPRSTRRHRRRACRSSSSSRGERFYAVAARTFADARPGDIILYEDSYRNMSLAISGGSAAAMLHARAGQSLRISVLQP